MRQTPSARRSVRSAGQSVYEVMLIAACAAMALAVCFAVYEYSSLYHGPTSPSEFVSRAATPPAPARKAAPTTATTVAPPPAPTGAPGATVTPAPARKAAPTTATTVAPPPAPTAAPGATAAPSS